MLVVILILDCKYITAKYERTRSKHFFSTVGTLFLTMWILSRSFLKHLSIKFSRYPFLRSSRFKKINSLKFCKDKNIYKLKCIPYQIYKQKVKKLSKLLYTPLKVGLT